MLEDEADLPAAYVASGHVLVVKLDRTAVRIGTFQAGDDPQERGLARPGGTEQGHEFARFAPSG